MLPALLYHFPIMEIIGQSGGAVECRGILPPNECSGYDTK